jgi:hypothetical protein
MTTANGTRSRSACAKRKIRKARKVWAGRIKVALIAIAGFIVLMAILHPGQHSSIPGQNTIASVEEDSPQFDCTMMANRICGPGNEQGAPAGLYDQGGVLIVGWDEWLANLNEIDRQAHANH